MIPLNNGGLHSSLLSFSISSIFHDNDKNTDWNSLEELFQIKCEISFLTSSNEEWDEIFLEMIYGSVEPVTTVPPTLSPLEKKAMLKKSVWDKDRMRWEIGKE